jgi:hypothetical protein
MASIARPLLIVMAIVLVAKSSMGQGAAHQATARSGATTEGRFQIVMRDGVRADTFLLDTQEGRVWQLTQFTGIDSQPTVWVPMKRIDSAKDLQALIDGD